MRMFVLWLVLLVLPLQAFSGQILTAQQAYQIQTQQQGAVLHVHARIAPDCYLYRDRFRVKSVSSALHSGTPVFLTIPLLKDDPEFGKVAVFHRQMDVDIPFEGQGALLLGWQGCNERVGLCYPPQTLLVAVKAAAATATAQAVPRPPESHRSLMFWLYRLLEFYLGGLAMSLTPCVWPMVPILSGIIARQSGSGQTVPGRTQRSLLSLSYVLGTACSYGLLGAVFSGMGQRISLALWFQTPLWLIGMSLIFIALALSLFGFYSLRLPAVLNNALDTWSRRQRLGSLAGTFMMGVLAALVVSPCVSAPMAAALMYVSQVGNVFLGFLALFILGLGIGTPLFLLGVSEAQWLPRAGAWMQGVQAALGVGLLATAVNLLARLLPEFYEWGLYGLLLIGSGVALGALEAADYGWPRVRKAAGIALLLIGGFSVLQAWTLWLGPHTAATSGNTMRATSTGIAPAAVVSTPAELQAMLERYRGQEILLDFWARWCISCQEIEHEVLVVPAVQQRLQQRLLLRVDVTQRTAETDALLQQFQIPGPPALILLNAEGQVRRPWLNGAVSAQALINYLDGR